MKYVGVDYHKRYSHVTVLAETGGVVERRRIENDPSAWSALLGKIGDRSKVVVEAGRNVMWIHDLLEEHADDVVVAHPMKVKAIASAKIKTDAIDSRVLAELLRADLIPPAHVASRAVRPARDVLRQRLFLVRLRTQLKNRIHVLVDRHPEWVRPPAANTDLFGRTGRQWLAELRLPGEEQKLLAQDVELLDVFDQNIRTSERWIARVSRGNAVVIRLRTIPGIGAFFSALLWAEIDGIDRFPTPGHLHAYAGLVPSTYASGGKTFHGRITKQGNKWIRWAMIEAVQPAIVHDWELRRFYEHLKARKGANVAKVATARRLLTLVYRVWKDNRPYQTRYILGSPRTATSQS